MDIADKPGLIHPAAYSDAGGRVDEPMPDGVTDPHPTGYGYLDQPSADVAPPEAAVDKAGLISSGEVFLVFIVAVLLTWLASWLVSQRFRRRMLGLMRAGPAPDADRAQPPELALVPLPRPAPDLDFAANGRAQVRLLAVLSGLSLLIGLVQSGLALQFVYTRDEFSLHRLLVLGAVYAWPMVLAWGLVRRWSWARMLAGVAVYMVAMLVLVLARSDGGQTLASAGTWLAAQVAIPIAVVILIGASGRIRAVAPYLLLPFLLLATASDLGLRIVAAGVAAESTWLVALANGLGAEGTLLLFVLAPWLPMAWLVQALGRRLARAYRGKGFSDLAYLFGVYWLVILFASAIAALDRAGLAALVQIAAWLCLPLAWVGARGWLAPPANPPTLLVLRVFQHDAQVERLFDLVVERWRLSGNTLLIAGTDLISRTLDPDELFAFLDRRLPERFVASEAELPQRLAALDLAPDPDGRYRVNELFCFDATWQAALGGLVGKADVVLMDLRGFQPGNLGCRYELGLLARAAQSLRVVLLYDRDTALDAARAAVADAPAGRFVWLDANEQDPARAGDILQALFGPVGQGGAPEALPAR